MFRCHESYHLKIAPHRFQNDKHNDQNQTLRHEKISLHNMNHSKISIFPYHAAHHFSTHHCINILEMGHDKSPIHWPNYSVFLLHIHNHCYNNTFLLHEQSPQRMSPYNMSHLQRRIIPYHEICYSAIRHDNNHLVILFASMSRCKFHAGTFIA